MVYQVPENTFASDYAYRDDCPVSDSWSIAGVELDQQVEHIEADKH